MDDYPPDLAPEIKDGFGVITPFHEWWERAHHHFPNVPENVAEQWLHRHWGYSPYSWLKSKNYKFDLTVWDSSKLWEIWSRWRENKGIEECVKHGGHLVGQLDFWLKNFMVANKTFPTPIIVLDNRDDNLSKIAPNKRIPQGFILIEGHLRFNIAIYLQKTGDFNPQMEIWLMHRIKS